MKQEATKWDIPWTVLFKIVLVAVAVYALFLIRGILVLGLAALVISIIFNPVISFLHKRRIPRTVGAVMVYGGSVLIIGLIGYLVAPSIIIEANNFSQNFSHYFYAYFQNLSVFSQISDFDFNNLAANPAISENLLNFSKGVFSFISSFVGGLMAMVTMFVLAFFLSVEENDLTKLIKSFSPKRWEENILKAWQKSQEQVMGWFGGRIIASIAVALMTFIACFILHIKFTVSVSVLCGLLNLVPLIGPIVASIILFSLGLLNSWTVALTILLLSIIIQFIENNILTPFVSRQIIGIPNFLVLLSILIGAQLLGFVGAILAIPLGAVLYETLKNYIAYKKNQD